MILTIEISSHAEQALAREAQSRGIAIPELAAHPIEAAVAGGQALATNRRSAGEIREWLDSLTEFADAMLQMPGGVLREMIYQGDE